MSIFSRLFGGSTQPISRTSRLGLESFDDRCLPSVTTSVTPQGVLAIQGDEYNNQVRVLNSTAPYQAGNYTIQVASVEVQARSNSTQNFQKVANVPMVNVRGITFNGGAGNDTFNGAMLLGTNLLGISGGEGNDTLIGSFRSDIFLGSPGNDTYLGMFGADLLERNGHRGYFADNGFGNDVTTGLVNGKLSYGELTTINAKLFARPVPGDSTKIELYGPSGAGFTLKANSWIKTDVPNLQHTSYRATGTTVKMVTENGEIPLPASAFQNFRIGYSTGGATTFAGPVLNNLRIDLIDALGGLTDTIESKTGMSVQLPNLGGGLAIGNDLDHLDLPLAPAVPYLYGTLSPTVGISVGDLSPSIPLPTNGWGVSIAVDPTDIGGMVKLSTPWIELGFGWSQNGEIPYSPTYTPDDRSNPGISGNLYISASGSLPSLPISLSGELVMDLDANDDGRFCGLTAANMGKLVRGKETLGVLASVVNDVKLGFNGEIAATLPVAKNLDLELTLGRGSVYWNPGQNGQPGEAAFRAKSVNPFEDTMFEKFFTGSSVDMQGRFNTNGDFRFAADVKSFDVDLEVAGVSIASASQSFGVEFSKTGSNISLGASYNFEATLGSMDFLGARVEIDAELDFTVNTSTGKISVSGSGDVEGEICLFGADLSVNIGVSFDNTGIEVDLPGKPLDFEIKW